MLAACHRSHGSAPVPPPPPAVVVEAPGRRSDGPLTGAERDSIIAEVQARRSAWRARGITSYRLTVAVGCFCPWPSTPAVIEVRSGTVVALRDTTGKSLGKPREPWSGNTVEALFDAVEQGARRNDVLTVGYDPAYGYPAAIRGDSKLGLPDDWFWVRARSLTPLR